MKVEKCPRCKGEMETDIYKNKVYFSCWRHTESAYLVALARAKFNSWARREAKRIEKEGATK